LFSRGRPLGAQFQIGLGNNGPPPTIFQFLSPWAHPVQTWRIEDSALKSSVGRNLGPRLEPGEKIAGMLCELSAMGAEVLMRVRPGVWINRGPQMRAGRFLRMGSLSELGLILLRKGWFWRLVGFKGGLQEDRGGAGSSKKSLIFLGDPSGSRTRVPDVRERLAGLRMSITEDH
jgi:hypothetical protein